MRDHLRATGERALIVGRHLQPLASPDPSTRLSLTAGTTQNLGDLAIAVVAILPSQLDDVGSQPLFIVSAPRDVAVRRAVLWRP
jgi:hypothetical protein